jgi:cytochrome c peroxidase
MKRYYLLATAGLAVALVVACAKNQAVRQPEASPLAQVTTFYQQRIDTLAQRVAHLTLVVEQNRPAPEIQQAFRTARLAYKQVEFLAEYYNPTTAKSLNGPALDEFEEEDGRVNPPQGFQVVEEYLFPYDTTQRAELRTQIGILAGNVKHLAYTARDPRFTDAHVWDALRLQVFRIITLGISGFDSPVAQHSLPEAQASLAGLKQVTQFYLLPNAQPNLSSTLVATALDQAITYLQTQPDFNQFDRLTFIEKHANVVSRALFQAQQGLAIPFFVEENRFLRANAQTMFDSGAFNPDFYRPTQAPPRSPELVALGEALFNDPLLGGQPGRSCNSCHQADRAFTDGLSTSQRFDGRGFIARNAPSLYNVALQPTQFYEGRVAFLEDQIADVLATPDEMHSSVAQVVAKLNRQPGYLGKFRQIFGPVNPPVGQPTAYRPAAHAQPDSITGPQFQAALAAYLRSLTSLNSRWDRYLRGETTLLSDEEKWGFNLFMGKAKCATCHFMPLFNGTVPPHFQVAESEVLGTPARPDTTRATVDPDLGKFHLTKADLHRHAFKTVTVRNAELTAPYMHNGVYRTLAQVVDFYNRGGGAGIGIALDNQTLPPDPLQLSLAEQRALVAFMTALTDAPASSPRPQ